MPHHIPVLSGPEQDEVLARHAGASRLAFNQCLRIVKTALTQRRTVPGPARVSPTDRVRAGMDVPFAADGGAGARTCHETRPPHSRPASTTNLQAVSGYFGNASASTCKRCSPISPSTFKTLSRVAAHAPALRGARSIRC
ncbi:helix-turn-helix domain-containing protein [Mycobacterium ostraviense]|uniref:helix-turn-helix domain-containing protein n=1 Tax=Mycobacterium ostraviense TaxID=2738409 RepID=UPI00137B0B2E